MSKSKRLRHWRVMDDNERSSEAINDRFKLIGMIKRYQDSSSLASSRKRLALVGRGESAVHAGGLRFDHQVKAQHVLVRQKRSQIAPLVRFLNHACCTARFCHSDLHEIVIGRNLACSLRKRETRTTSG